MAEELAARVLEGGLAGLAYGLTGYARSRAARGSALRGEGLLSSVIWGALVGLVSGLLGVRLEAAERILLDIGGLALVKKLAEAAWHGLVAKRVWAR